MKYRSDQRESKEFKADLAKLNEALDGGYDAAGPHAYEKKENVAREEFIEDQVQLSSVALLNCLLLCWSVGWWVCLPVKLCYLLLFFSKLLVLR